MAKLSSLMENHHSTEQLLQRQTAPEVEVSEVVPSCSSTLLQPVLLPVDHHHISFKFSTGLTVQ